MLYVYEYAGSVYNNYMLQLHRGQMKSVGSTTDNVMCVPFVRPQESSVQISTVTHVVCGLTVWKAKLERLSHKSGS